MSDKNDDIIMTLNQTLDDSFDSTNRQAFVDREAEIDPKITKEELKIEADGKNKKTECFCIRWVRKCKEKIDLFKVRLPYLHNLDGKRSFSSIRTLSVSIFMISGCFAYLTTKMLLLGDL